MDSKLIAGFTSVCEEDVGFLPRYLVEAERLQLPFVMHFDKCSQETKDLVSAHPMCIGTTSYDSDEWFNELHKQEALDKVISLGYKWAINWDVDETFEKEARVKFDSLAERREDAVLDYKWVNLWEDEDHIRVDGPMAQGHRTRIYNLQHNYIWKFYNPKINGAAAFERNGRKTFLRKEVGIGKIDLVCLHWGMMTQAMRLAHKERWDKLYGKHTDNGKNPYGFWEWASDETITPVTAPNGYK